MRLPEPLEPSTLERRLFTGLLPLPGSGIDVGAGADLPPEWRWWEHESLRMECRPWDIEDGDAHLLAGVEDNSYDWLTASHILEHLAQPVVALTNWLRVVKPAGTLLISVPHRNLYERRDKLPSRWNPAGHVRYYLPYRSEPPHTVGLYEWLTTWETELGFNLEYLYTGDWGNTNTHRQDEHPNGEYCIDALLRKDY